MNTNKVFYYWEMGDGCEGLDLDLITDLWRDHKTPKEISDLTGYPLHKVFRVMRKNLLID